MSTHTALAIAPLEDADVAAVVALWRRCGLTRPWNDPEGDIALARQDTNAAVLLGRDGDAVVASVLVGHDGHRGWVYYVAVDPQHGRKGFGRAIMAAAEDWLRVRGILKLLLLVRPENTKVQAFYEALDYDEQERIVFAKWLDGRDPTP
jgi:ribosomal protein S18 acetylase RimI-like enzyme